MRGFNLIPAKFLLAICFTAIWVNQRPQESSITPSNLSPTHHYQVRYGMLNKE